MPAIAPPARGLLQVASPDEVTQAMGEQDRQRAEAGQPEAQDQSLDELAGYIRTKWDQFRSHRNGIAGWNDRLLHAQRTFNRQYDPQKLQEIRQFDGSEIYAGVTAVKCRGASSLLREVYLGAEKPWGLDPTPDPTLPDDVTGAVTQLVQSELQTQSQAGQPVDPAQIRDRVDGLMEAARQAAKKKAREEAKIAEDKLNDYLVEGQFYRAIAEFIVDLPIFPFACVKGPVVRIVPHVKWVQGKAQVQNKAKMFWSRVSPFDLFWSPGVSSIEDADVIERTRLTRTDLNDLLGVPGYNEDAIRQVLIEYGKGGLRDWMDPTDSERALQENRENPNFNTSGMIDCIEFHGNIQGQMLLDYGLEADAIQDPVRDYFVQAWVIGRYVIKAQIAPSPRKRHPYYITSFEKVPGTPVGNALPDILSDIQDVCNASLRNLVNNLSISSGPQVVINDDRMSNLSDGDALYPWKRWHVSSDPLATNQGSLQPVYFFQPQSNAQELLGVYEKFTQIADELSAIPRYVTGSERLGGAGRTASGLAMLMGNASKILQTVAANIDRDVINGILEALYDMVMLTDQSGLFRGDESIRVRGVDVAVQRETDRQRQIEFLQQTANPIDMQIMGVPGRAKVLRSVSQEIGLDGQDIIPTDDEIKAQMQAQATAAQVQAQQGVTQPGNPGQPGQAPQGGAPGGAPGAAPGGGPPLNAHPQVPHPPAPANTGLGVGDGKAMRGMAG